jgi:hypothetical protein
VVFFFICYGLSLLKLKCCSKSFSKHGSYGVLKNPTGAQLSRYGVLILALEEGLFRGMMEVCDVISLAAEFMVGRWFGFEV